MHTLRHLALAASAAALALAGAAQPSAADTAPPSPAQSCGPNCRFQAIALPGGVVELAGAYDCGSASCWSGDAVKLTWDVGAKGCLSATATPYSPSDNGSHSARVSSRLKADGASFSAGGFQISSGSGLEGFFFNVFCSK